MAKTWANRLKSLITARGWSVAEYHRRVNASTPSDSEITVDAIRKYISGRVEKPRGDVLQRLAAPFEKTELYLLYGTDIPHRLAYDRIPLLTMADVGTIEPSVLKSKLWEGASVVADITDIEENLIAVQLNDDSCVPEIRRGSTVFCKLMDPEKIEPGSLVVAKVHGLSEGVCRKFRLKSLRDRRHFRLVAINPDYPDIESSQEMPITVFGKVVRVLSNYP